jgi:hypothetical protein
MTGWWFKLQVVIKERLKMKTSVFAGGVDSLPAAEQESNDDITEGEKDPSTSTRTRQVYFVKKN